MIVEPDFPDHWKTLMLTDILGEAAPIYVIRLWAHCQKRKQFMFEDLPPAALRSICRFAGQANQLESSLVKTGFISRDASGVLTVEGWAEYNASLIANWKNGGKGGRPKKPTENPPETHGLAMGNPPRTDRSGLDEIREEKKESSNPPSKATHNAPDKPASRAEYGQEFESWWRVYPRHEAKGQAAKAFSIVVKGLALMPEHTGRPAALEWLLARTLAFAESPKGKGEFVPHPATWLNQRRFDDDDREWHRTDRPQTRRSVAAYNPADGL